MIGIWLSGFEQVHWFAYIVPGALLFAAASSYCADLVIARIILKVSGIGHKQTQTS